MARPAPSVQGEIAPRLTSAPLPSGPPPPGHAGRVGGAMAVLRTAAPRRPAPGRRRAEPVPSGRAVVVLVLSALAGAAGCAIGPTPGSPPVTGASLAPPVPMGYVVCPGAVTPVELSSRTPEAPIVLPSTGAPSAGGTAIAVAPGGRWAYVVRSTGGTGGAGATGNEVVPVDLVSQRAGRPIPLPGHGPARAVVVTPDGRTVVAASGSALVRVDPVARTVGAPLDLGPGRTVAGLARAPSGPTVWALVPGAVVPVDTATWTAGAPAATGLQVSSLSSPHGVAVTPDGATVVVVGQGGTDYGGRLVPVAAATGAAGPGASFDRFGIAAPAAVAVTPDGARALVVDSADRWVTTVPLRPTVGPPATPATPVRLPTARAGQPSTGQPSDIVVGPGGPGGGGAYVVAGFDAVLPYDPATGAFGSPMRVCSGATSMAVAAARRP